MDYGKQPIYLDYAATTPLDPRVLEAMLPYFNEKFGNPSSIHRYGQEADTALENSRIKIAKLLNCRSDEIIFTSGGSESDNLALRGASLIMKQKYGANHILITPVEHHAILRTAQQLADQFGFELEFIPIDRFGIVDPIDIEKRIRSKTAVISVIWGNNEIGSINPINDIASICRKYEVPFHTDAVQAAAHLPIDLQKVGVDLISIGAHKFYGPKGVGALFVRKGTSLLPMQTGGGQEYGIRAGTHNLPYIVGLAEALFYAQTDWKVREQKYIPFRDQIIGEVLENIPGAQLTGHPTDRLPNHSSFVFDGVDGNNLMIQLDMLGFACSSGSACKTGNPEPSEVLIALGISRHSALGSLRITLGVSTTQNDIDLLLDTLPRAINNARNR